MAIDGKKCVLLVLLDLSAAFDTIDHKTRLSHLSNKYGVKGTTLKWFEINISDCVCSMVIDGVESELLSLLFGVSQGSVLVLMLFILYTPLGNLFRQSASLTKMEECIEKVRI